MSNFKSAIEYYEDIFDSDHGFISHRKDVSRRFGSYGDRNDGFARTLFSSSKANFSRHRKIGKLNKKRSRYSIRFPI